MKILRIKVDGLPLYKEPFDVSFYAVQRTESSHMDMLYKLFGNIYINTAEAIIGINASGKTTALKVIHYASLILRASPLNGYPVPVLVLNNAKTTFDIDFFSGNRIYHLHSVLVRTKNNDGEFHTSFESEELTSKPVTSKVNKTNLLDFNGIAPEIDRKDAGDYLPDDVSIMIALNKKTGDKPMFVDLATLTNYNFLLPDEDSAPAEILSLLDPTVEYIRIDNPDPFYARLKFFGQDEISINSQVMLERYLSSGTIKGVTVFSYAVRVLKEGGYLFIDEIENHFNRELVATLLRLFMNPKVNPKGAVIVFSTHYSELLDEIERNDAVFIARNSDGLTLENLNDRLDRNDHKKSEIYESNYLGGTAPKYESILALQKSIMKTREE